MEFQVSARKYRPGTFGEVIGQPHVVQTLVNAITSQRIAHAFLFSGTRGVGKTTVARILAKALNCERGPTSTPCDICPNCVEITQGTSVDVIEIDGASNTGVDDVREIRENVKFAPFRGSYRVYIIDEVHMLSNSAFNALLKTLEEPPAHVVFIFATTEIHKIPPTILSRCQHYNFRRIPRTEIIQRLRHVADQDGIEVEDRSLAAIARASEGSMRDALSLLDQAVAFGGKSIKQTDLETLLGAVPQEHVRGMVDAVIRQDSAAAVQIVAQVLDQGHDLRAYCADVVEHVRNMLVSAVVPSSSGASGSADLTALKGVIELSEEEIRQVLTDAKAFGPDHLQELFRIFAHAEDSLRLSTHPRFVLEVAAIRATRVGVAGTHPPPKAESRGGSQASGQARPPQSEAGRTVSSPVRASPPTPERAGEPARLNAPQPGRASGTLHTERPAMPPAPPPPPAQASGQGQPQQSLAKTQSQLAGSSAAAPAPSTLDAPSEPAPFTWEEILERVDSAHPSLSPFLAQGTLAGIDNGLVRIGYPKNASVARTRVEKPDALKMLGEICSELAGYPVRLRVEELPDGQPAGPSMAQLRTAKQQNQKEALLAQARSHPLVKQATELFGAEVIEVRQQSPQEDSRS